MRTTGGLAAVGTALAMAGSAHAAERLIETVDGPDFQVGAAGTTKLVTFTTTEPVTGIGFTALWTAVVADLEDGLAPWSLDLGITITAPNGTSQLAWPQLGGDVTIADYPLQDSTSGFAHVDGQGTFTWDFTSISGPWVAGLEGVQYHVMGSASDVVEMRNGSVATGPLWNRPFFIAGVSGLGPVVYQVMPFRVLIAGSYRFDSVVAAGNNFTFLYQDAFDASQPLSNLLDYGLGNGNAPNGTPAGTSLIEALLFEGRTYYYVTSQWSAITPGQSFTTTITGPGGLLCPEDLDPSGEIGFDDLLLVLSAWGPCATSPCAADLDHSGDVGFDDLLAILSTWGECSP